MRFSLSKHGLPLLAAGALAFTISSVIGAHPSRPRTQPTLAPPTSPYAARVAGSGTVEPAGEAVAVANEIGGVVVAVPAAAGRAVKKGDILFALDDRAHRAALAEAEAALDGARRAIETLDRQIDWQGARIAEARAARVAAAAEAERAAADRARYQALMRQDWASRQRGEATEAEARKAAAAEAQAQAALAAAEKHLDVLRAQRAEAEARLASAAARRDRAAIDLDRTAVRAPIDATVLKVNVRVGEFAPAGAAAEPPVSLGVTQTLHVRVEIDEADAWRVRAGAPAIAALRGNAAIRARLVFVRFEPVVVPKRNLAGGQAERVDTRVLQVVYEFAPAEFPARIGQQVDVFVEAEPLPPRTAER
jgi:multidrug resistance efflux pump